MGHGTRQWHETRIYDKHTRTWWASGEFTQVDGRLGWEVVHKWPWSWIWWPFWVNRDIEERVRVSAAIAIYMYLTSSSSFTSLTGSRNKNLRIVSVGTTRTASALHTSTCVGIFILDIRVLTALMCFLTMWLTDWSNESEKPLTHQNPWDYPDPRWHSSAQIARLQMHIELCSYCLLPTSKCNVLGERHWQLECSIPGIC